MIAISAMSATVQALFFLIAVVCFVLAGLSVSVRKMNLIGFGLAFFVFVSMWNAFAAAG